MFAWRYSSRLPGSRPGAIRHCRTSRLPMPCTASDLLSVIAEESKERNQLAEKDHAEKQKQAAPPLVRPPNPAASDEPSPRMGTPPHGVGEA
jgi:hypothetical protein